MHSLKHWTGQRLSVLAASHQSLSAHLAACSFVLALNYQELPDQELCPIHLLSLMRLSHRPSRRQKLLRERESLGHQSLGIGL